MGVCTVARLGTFETFDFGWTGCSRNRRIVAVVVAVAAAVVVECGDCCVVVVETA